MKYIERLEHFKDDQFEVAAATKVEEAETVIGAGFESIAEKNSM
jgi:hypothetical protein